MASLRHFFRLMGMARQLARFDALDLVEPFERTRPLLKAMRRLATVTVRRAPNCPERPGQRLAAALQASGPAFIKLGQTLATRADLVGDEFADDLTELQDRLPPFDGDEAVATIEAELGGPLDRFFKTFDRKAIAAASIAQVHLAVTIDDQEVAVKVLRPGIEERFAADLESFLWLASLVERALPRARRLRPREIVETLAISVRQEMDLTLEAAAASELAENMQGQEGYRVPQPDWARTAKRVLTMERVRGVPIGDGAALEAAGHDRKALAKRIVRTFLTQAIGDGFFHADLHQGNFFVEEDGTVVPVDFGIMGRLDRASRRYLAEILWGYHKRDYRRIAEVHFEAGYIPETESVELFAQALRAIGEPIMDRPLAEISLGHMLAQLMATTERFSMETQPQLLTLQRTMVMAEGLALRLDPEVNMWEVSRPVLEEQVRDILSPSAHLIDGLAALTRFMKRLPDALQHVEDILDVLAKERSGKAAENQT